jgi:hypothetical protein
LSSFASSETITITERLPDPTESEKAVTCKFIGLLIVFVSLMVMLVYVTVVETLYSDAGGLLQAATSGVVVGQPHPSRTVVIVEPSGKPVTEEFGILSVTSICDIQ